MLVLSVFRFAHERTHARVLIRQEAGKSGTRGAAQGKQFSDGRFARESRVIALGKDEIKERMEGAHGKSMRHGDETRARWRPSWV